MHLSRKYSILPILSLMVTTTLLLLLTVLVWFSVIAPVHAAQVERARVQLIKELRAHMAHAVLQHHPLFKVLPSEVKPSIKELREHWNVTELYGQLYGRSDAP